MKIMVNPINLKKWINVLALSVLMTACQQHTATQSETSTAQISAHGEYQNPILDNYLADPFVILDGDYYYMMGSHTSPDDRFIPIYRSKNLNDWEFVRGAVNNGQKTDWNHKHFWAPEVIKIKDTYYLYYTASKEDSPENIHNRVGLATAKNIEGPYTDHGVVIPYGSIDGHPFIDNDDQMYMYFTAETKNSLGIPRGKIYVLKMSDPYTVEGDPIELIGWNGWQEGAFILPKDGEYWMTYSRNGWKTERYEVMLAKAPHPTGPFVGIDKPLLHSSDLVKGPGHNSIFMDVNNQPWLVYHGWDPEFKARYPRIDPLYWEQGELKCDGPTMDLQRF